MNRTERLHAIVNELRLAAPRGRTAAWLANHFEVSARTIKRDMRALHDSDIGLVAEDGRGGGYAIDRTRSLPPLGFTAGEATAIAVAIGAAPDLPFQVDARAALTRILAAMAPSQRASARDLAARLWIRDQTARSRWAKVIDEALRQRVVLHLDYVDERGAQTPNRAVEPMALARTRHHWHLLGWCHLRGAGRWFRTDRVISARLTRTPVKPRDLQATFGPPPDDARPVHLPGGALHPVDHPAGQGPVDDRPTTEIPTDVADQSG